MELTHTQRPETKQKVTLSPQVYQGLAILSMPIAELEQLVEQELTENPVLEMDEYEEELDELEEERAEELEEERAWDEWLEQYEDLEGYEPVVPRDPNAEAVNTEEFVGGVVTFEEYLLGQLAMMDVSEPVERAAKAIIASLDDDGFFAGDLDEIAEIVGVDPEDAEQALGLVKRFDPPGVGARDAREALGIQVGALGLEEELLVPIIREHLDDVAGSRYRLIARALKVKEERVREVVEVLRTLNPRPAGAYSSGVSPAYVEPDITLRRFGDEWLIIPNSDAVPTLRVSPRYRRMLKRPETVDDETVRYLKDKIRGAESFIKNVERRKDTVSRIAEIILQTQADFFEDGKGDLRPLRLEDVAVEIGVHLSTVSRGVTGKYMATPYGLFELKYFFSGGYRTAQGMDVAATSVKNRIKDIVAEEDPDSPLSDQQIADELEEEGVSVARRTVAKYRDELGIDPSWARRRR